MYRSNVYWEITKTFCICIGCTIKPQIFCDVNDEVTPILFITSFNNVVANQFYKRTYLNIISFEIS